MQKIFIGVFFQWYMVVICISCALFVMSQFDVIVMAKFVDIIIYIFFYIHSPYFVCLCTE